MQMEFLLRPEALFSQKIFSLDDVKRVAHTYEEIPYLSVGGGIGSFCWVNALRVHGIQETEIGVISLSDTPYDQFKSYCEHSGLFSDDRLRSDSGARPDNFWGFPGYAINEMIDSVREKKLRKAFGILTRIVSEPLNSEFYTPTTERLYKSLDREMERIGWGRCLKKGKALAVRKTNEGRYVVFYEQEDGSIRAIVTSILHLSLGHSMKYPEYVQNTSQRVLSSYTLPTGFFEYVKTRNLHIAVVGRGIVASYLIERLFKTNPNSTVTSVFRKPIEEDKDTRNKKRAVYKGWKLQPFNWPRSAFSGRIMEQIKKTDPAYRKTLSSAWSSPTTPPRKDWMKLLEEKSNANQYHVIYGEVSEVKEQGNYLSLRTSLEDSHATTNSTVMVDYVIDCSGFDDKAENKALYADLIRTYDLPLTYTGGLTVDEQFSLTALSSEKGRVYVTGCGVSGNAYGPVDSFFGHQYASIQVINDLVSLPFVSLKKLNAVTSLKGWVNWMRNTQI